MCATEHFFSADNQQYAKNITLIVINFFYIYILIICVGLIAYKITIRNRYWTVYIATLNTLLIKINPLEGIETVVV